MSPIQLTIWQTDDPNDHILQCMQCTRKGFNRFCRCCLVLSPFQFIALSRKWVATIVCEMANKGQYGMTYHLHTRPENVKRIWYKIATSRWTSKTQVVRALTSNGKLYQAILLVYVYWNRNHHKNPQGIFDWACWVLRFQ